MWIQGIWKTTGGVGEIGREREREREICLSMGERHRRDLSGFVLKLMRGQRAHHRMRDVKSISCPTCQFDPELA